MGTMTLEQLRDWHHKRAEILRSNAKNSPWIDCDIAITEHGKMANCIDAHLAKLREPVSEEDIAQACRRYYNSGEEVYAPSYEAMKKALTDFLARRLGEMK